MARVFFPLQGVPGRRTARAEAAQSLPHALTGVSDESFCMPIVNRRLYLWQRVVVVVVVYLLVASATASATPGAATDPTCNTTATVLEPESGESDSWHDTKVVPVAWHAENESSVSTATQTQSVRLSVASHGGVPNGIVGAVGQGNLSTQWTAPCTGTYSVTVGYTLDGELEQTRQARLTGNGVSRVIVNSSVLVVDTDSPIGGERIAQRNETAWDGMIPTWSALAKDGFINVVIALLNNLTGHHIGGVVTDQAGINRNATHLSHQFTPTEEAIRVTFQAQEGHTYSFTHRLRAIAAAASIASGQADAEVAVQSTVTKISVTNDAASAQSDSVEIHTLELVPTGEDTTYYVRVSDSLEAANINGRETNSDDTVSRDRAMGRLMAGKQGDSYRYTGTITELTVPEGEVEIFVDGREVDPDRYESGEERGAEHTLEVIPVGEEAEYRITVSGILQPGDVNSRALNTEDTISADGHTAEGVVLPGYQGDSYRYTGEIERITLVSGEAGFRVDGRPIAPDSTPSDSEQHDKEDSVTNPTDDQEPQLLEIVATEEASISYEIVVQGSAEKTRLSEKIGAGDNDMIRQTDSDTTTIRGFTGNTGYGDAYYIDGEIIDFRRLNGTADITIWLDGDPVSPSELAVRSRLEDHEIPMTETEGSPVIHDSGENDMRIRID